MAEWSKAHAWKVCKRQRFEGSNPSLTAIIKSNTIQKHRETNFNKTLILDFRVNKDLTNIVWSKDTMTILIITGLALLIVEIMLETLRAKLFKSIELTTHKALLAKMYLPKNIFKPFRKPEWTPIKYIFTRKHKELNNKPLSKLSDITLVTYLISWLFWLFFALHLSVTYL